MTTVALASARSRAIAGRLSRTPVVRGTLGTRTGRVGVAICVLVLLLAIIGPLVRPYDPTAPLGTPFEPPSSAHVLGTDFLGRDVLSRFLSGGLAIIFVGILAPVLAYAIGIPIGMVAGYRRGGPTDWLTASVVDVWLAFPPIILVLGLLAAAGPALTVVVLGIAAVFLPRIIRVVRSITIEVASAEFVEAAVARGERTRSIVFREILPNIWTPALADFGLRVTGSLILFASLAFLGLGVEPPASNWGLMISENRLGISINPWTIIAPAIALALITIGVNLMADSVARSVGRSIVGRDA
jgi:peptide/nickel transport system permease protein